MARRPTISDISRDAGVSKRTVSRVINNSPLVSERTRQRVLASIRRLNYQPNIVARSLAGGRNRILGVFVYERSFPLEPPDFYYPFLMGIQAEAMAQDYNLLLYVRHHRPGATPTVYPDGSNVLQTADGSVILGAHTDREELKRLKQEGYPFVYVGRRDIDDCLIDYVTADYATTTAEAVELLHDWGHERIAFVVQDPFIEPAQERLRGFLCGLRSHGLEERWVFRRTAIEQVGFAEWLKELRAEGVTGVVTSDASLALNVLRATATIGVRVPVDLSLIALADPIDSGFRDFPPLTYLAVPRREMGRMAVRLLVSRLEPGKDVGTIQRIIPCRLVAGDTVARRQR
ncbi:MAG: LacI family DNA-binding transcriptional regulator [Anaerolineae bacterium]